MTKSCNSNMRIWIKNEKVLKFPTTVEYNGDGTIDYICVDFDEVGYWPSQVAMMMNSGVRDITDTWIYEGDKVVATPLNKASIISAEADDAFDIEDASNVIGEVKYDNGSFYIQTKGNDDLLSASEILLSELVKSKWSIKIIGNIYEGEKKKLGNVVSISKKRVRSNL